MKRMRQSATQRGRNRHYRSAMRTQIKQVRAAIDAGDHDTASAKLPATVSIIQKLAQKGVLHKRQANRRVARLHKAVNSLKASS